MKNVLRMKPGEEILISNGVDKDYRCQVETLDSDAVTVRICQWTRREPNFRKDLSVPGTSQTGKDGIDRPEGRGTWCLPGDSSSHEAFCGEIRCQEGRNQDPPLEYHRGERSQAVQTDRDPGSDRVMSVKEALAYAADFDLKLLPYENARGMAATKEQVEAVRPGMDIAVFIGPEGGFEETEVEEARAAGFYPVSLGKRILRTETAGLTMLSILMYQMETAK